MPVTIYESTDASAPVLSGTVGSLVAVLDACLVNGYGSKAAAGWTKAFSGTNKAAYRQGVKTGRLQLYLRVQDDGPGAGGAQEARVRGYETMTNVDTGTGLSPTAAQLAAGIICRKSATADAVARAWVVAADHRTFYLFAASEGTPSSYYSIMSGDIRSRVPADQYAAQIIGRVAENTGGDGDELFTKLVATYAALTGHYMARGLSGAGSAINNGKHSDFVKNLSAVMLGGGGVSFPDGAGGKLLLARADVHDVSPGAWRGWMRGIWNPLHPLENFSDGDVFTGDGRTYRIVKTLTASGAHGALALETSNTWDAD